MSNWEEGGREGGQEGGCEWDRGGGISYVPIYFHLNSLSVRCPNSSRITCARASGNIMHCKEEMEEVKLCVSKNHVYTFYPLETSGKVVYGCVSVSIY